jgi:hypothetical protein
MGRAWDGFAPAMTVKKPVNRAFVDFMSNLDFKSALDLTRGGNFSSGCTTEKGS